jgi:transcriptional regulator with XRE-family HTH domain
MNTGGTASEPVDEIRPSLAGPAVVRVLLGARMRRLREASGITCADAGYAIRGSHSKISRMELGRTGFKRRDVADLLTLYGVSDQVERDGLFSLLEQANSPGWLHEYGDVLSSSVETRLQLEQCASVIRCYENQFIPDLLQTADYARALIELYHPDAPRSDIARRVGLLTRRQMVLREPASCRLWAVIDEAALRRRPGTAATMRRQLRRLVEIAELPHVTIQVMPFSTGVTAGGAITVLRFAEPEIADVVYLDQFTGALYLTKPADVQHYAQVVDRLCTRAEPPAKTPALLRQLIHRI